MALGPRCSARTSPGIPRWRCWRRSIPYHTPCGGSGASLGVGCMAAWVSMAIPGRPHGSVGPPDALGCDNGPWQGPAPLQRRAGGPVRRQSTPSPGPWPGTGCGAPASSPQPCITAGRLQRVAIDREMARRGAAATPATRRAVRLARCAAPRSAKLHYGSPVTGGRAAVGT